MASISEFKNAIRSGLQRQHKWRVTINFPVGVAGTDVARNASLLARSTAVPESIVGVIELAWGGRILPYPGDRQFPEFTVSFIAVQDTSVRDAFERWSEIINGSESNTSIPLPGNNTSNLDVFFSDIQLDLLNSDDTVNKTYILRGAWPTVVGPMEMDSGALDTYVEFQTVFRYLNLVSANTR